MKKKDAKKKSLAKKVALYVGGTIALFTAASVFTVKCAPHITASIYKDALNGAKSDNSDDWGPEIEKK